MDYCLWIYMDVIYGFIRQNCSFLVFVGSVSVVGIVQFVGFLQVCRLCFVGF